MIDIYFLCQVTLRQVYPIYFLLSYIRRREAQSIILLSYSILQRFNELVNKMLPTYTHYTHSQSLSLEGEIVLPFQPFTFPFFFLGGTNIYVFCAPKVYFLRLLYSTYFTFKGQPRQR